MLNPLALLALVPLKDWLYAGTIAVLVGCGVYEYNHLINVGKHDIMVKINEANAVAKAKADKGVSDVADCYDGGGTWDRASGLCNTPTGK